MHTPKETDDLMEKWGEFTSRGRAEVITSFLNECSYKVTWEDWVSFLHKHLNVKEFE